MKKILVILLLFITTITLGVPITTQAWDKAITVIIDDVIKAFEVDVCPITKSDELLSPVRLISETLNIHVSWDPNTRTINYNNYLFMRLNDNTAELANGTTMQVPVPPQIVDDRTLVPFKFIAKQFGYDCSFNEKSNIVILKSNNTPMIQNIDYLITRICIYNNNAEEVQIPSYGNFNIGLNISKLTDAPDVKNVYLAVYNWNNRLIYLSTREIYLINGKSETIYIPVQNLNNKSIGKIKAFIWDNTENLVPVSNVRIY